MARDSNVSGVPATLYDAGQHGSTIPALPGAVIVLGVTSQLAELLDVEATQC